MAASFSLPTVLANLAAGNEPLSLIDGDFTAVYNPLVALSTFGNYYADSGAANAYVITVSSPQTVALAAGLPVQFLAANANTGASTLAINALGAKNIKNADGTALTAGQIPASSIATVMYDGTQFLLLNPVQGSKPVAKAWCQVTNAAGTYTLQAGSHNVSSINKTGTGIVQVFTSYTFGATTTMVPVPSILVASNQFATAAPTSVTMVTVDIRRSSTEANTDSSFGLVVYGT